MLAEISREKSGKGSLQKSNGKYSIVISYKVISADENGKKSKMHKSKWFATGLSVDGNNIRKASKMLDIVFDNFDPYNPDVSIKNLLNATEEQPSVEKLSKAGSTPETKAEPVIASSAPDDILFTDYMEQWLESMANKIELSTYGTYKMNVYMQQHIHKIKATTKCK